MTRNISDIDRDMARVRDTIARHTRAAQNLGTNIANQKAELAALEAERKALTTRPEPVARNITFVKRFGKVGGHEFHYAATSFTHEGTRQRLWSVTGKGFTKSVPWATVADFIDRHETDATRPKVQDLVPVTFHTAPNGGDAIQFSFNAEEAARIHKKTVPNPFVSHYEVFGGRL